MFRGKSRTEQFTEEMSSEREMSDKIMKDITDALDEGDAEALRKLYAKPAIASTPDLDEQIESLIDYYQGTRESFDGHASSSTKYRSGKTILEFKASYKLITTNEIYQIAYDHKPIDDVNPDEVGLYKVEFVTEEEYDKEVEANGFYHWKNSEEEAGAFYSYSDLE